MMKKIVVTGGHLTPALAVMANLQKNGWQIIFFGRRQAMEGDQAVSVEYRTVTQLGFPFIALTTGRWQRSVTRYTFFSLLKIPYGFLQSFYYLLKFRPAVILSFGGYLALPVALAGWILRIPVITHEQSVVPGLATKIISRLARKTCVSWEQTKDYLPKDKVVLTGNPIRKEVFSQTSQGVKLVNPGGGQVPLLYITGGNLGAHAINETVGQILPQLLERYQVIHQCGDSMVYRDYEKLSVISRQLSAEKRNRYVLTKYVESSDIGWVLEQAALVISRAGANTVTELAALGKPAIFIPLPWAGQEEQRLNAQLLVEAGTAVLLSQEKLTGETLSQGINSLIQNIGVYQKKAERAKSLVKLNAAERLTEIIEEVIDEKK